MLYRDYGMVLPRKKAQIYRESIASGTISLLFFKNNEEKRAPRKQIIFVLRSRVSKLLTNIRKAKIRS